MKPKVSIIIPTMTGGLSYLSSLLPLLSQEPDCEIIIIDNNSRDGTLNYLSHSTYECTVKINKRNEGFAIANNQAARIAQGEYLLLLNNDTAITSGFVSKMIGTFSLDEGIGAVGCLITKMEDVKRVQHAGVMFTQEYFPYELGLDISGISANLPFNDPRVHAVREVPAVTAACMMVKKNVWEQVGGFDEEYKNGWEDVAFNLRVREFGYKVYYTGETSIRHVHFGSKDYGRFNHEKENRAKYERDWVTTGKAKAVLGGFIYG